VNDEVSSGVPLVIRRHQQPPALVHCARSKALRSYSAMVRLVRRALSLLRYRINVQGRVADDGAANEDEVHEAMACCVCLRVHLANPATGRVLGLRNRPCPDGRHSITPLARSTSPAGTSWPIIFAALRLITSSKFVGCSTGRSAGLMPRNILTIIRARCRQT
jgi:hypothetical protein